MNQRILDLKEGFGILKFRGKIGEQHEELEFRKIGIQSQIEMFHIAFLLKTRQSETQLPQGIFAHVFLEKRKTEKVVSRVEY